jgi:nucleoside-diphosphate-sugar epimerase
VGAFTGTRVVVTGAAGFIGGHLVEALAARGATVSGIDRRPAPPEAPGAHICADLVDPAALDVVRGLVTEADVVFHLAARPGVRGHGPALDAARLRDNVEAATVVLAATPARVPVVVTSSSSVYGGATVCRGWIRPCREDDRLRPRGGYARSKVALEEACAARAARGGRVAVARPFTVAGERQRPDMAIARWLVAAAAGEPAVVLGSTARCRDVTDVGDVVRGLIWLAERGENTTVNLGTGRPVTLAAVLQAVAAAVGHPLEITPKAAGAEEPAATRADTRRGRRLLRFTPATALPELVARQWQATNLRSPAESARVLALTGAEC